MSWLLLQVTKKWLLVPGTCWSHMILLMEFTGFQFMDLEVPIAHCFALWNSQGLIFSLLLFLTWGYFFLLDFRESGREGERQKHQCERDRLDGLAPTHIPVRCQGLNLQPRYMPLTRINLREFSMWAHALTIESYLQGQKDIFNMGNQNQGIMLSSLFMSKMYFG